jgi:hypothetical protein
MMLASCKSGTKRATLAPLPQYSAAVVRQKQDGALELTWAKTRRGLCKRCNFLTMPRCYCCCTFILNLRQRCHLKSLTAASPTHHCFSMHRFTAAHWQLPATATTAANASATAGSAAANRPDAHRDASFSAGYPPQGIPQAPVLL